MTIQVEPGSLFDDAAALERVAARLDEIAAEVPRAATAADALAGADLRSADAAFEHLRRRWQADQSEVAHAIRTLAATARGAASAYRRVDGEAARAIRQLRDVL